MARAPRGASTIKRVDFCALERRHVAFYREAVLCLRVREMSIAFRKPAEQVRIQLDARLRINGIQPILFVDRLTQHDRPKTAALFEKVVKTPRADDVAQYAVDRRALRDRHLGLRDRTLAGDVDRRAAQEMQDADAFVPALAAHFDELLGRTLEPRRHHPAVVMPYRAKALPIAGVAPENPVFDDFTDPQTFVHGFHRILRSRGQPTFQDP